MSDAVTVPPELEDDIAAALAEGGARLAAYRPDVEPHAHVLNLDAGDVCEVVGPAAGGALHVVRGGIASSYLDAWALVGNVDGGPRPEVGQRVLVLDCPEERHTHEDHVGEVFHVNPEGEPTVKVEDGQCTPARWALLPAGADPARGDTPEASDAADDVSQNPLRNTEPDERDAGGEHECTSDRVCRVCGGPGRLEERRRFVADLLVVEGIMPTKQNIDHVIGTGDDDLLGSCPALDNDMPDGSYRTCGGPVPCARHGVYRAESGAYRVGRDGPPVPVATMDSIASAIGTSVPIGPAAPIPPGRWRTGSHAPRNLWIGGAHPEGVDVGRMDTPELAAYVVEAVNGRLVARREIDAAHLNAAMADEARVEMVAELSRRDALLTEARTERDEALAQVERYRDRLEKPCGECHDCEAPDRTRERDEARAEVERLRARKVTDDMVERAVAAFMGCIVGPIISDTSGMHDAIRDALEAALAGDS